MPGAVSGARVTQCTSRWAYEVGPAIAPNSQRRTAEGTLLRVPCRNSKGNARIVTQVSGSRVLLLSLLPGGYRWRGVEIALKGIQVSVWGAVNVLHLPGIAVLGKEGGELCQADRGTALRAALNTRAPPLPPLPTPQLMVKER